MPRRPPIEVRFDNNPGDWASIEFQVLIYLALTNPRSRARIRQGGPQGQQIGRPVNYQIHSNDVLEYMPRNRDLAELLVRLMEADKLRTLRRQLSSQGQADEVIIRQIEQRQQELDRKIQANRDQIERSLDGTIPEIVAELNRILEE